MLQIQLASKKRRRSRLPIDAWPWGHLRLLPTRATNFQFPLNLTRKANDIPNEFRGAGRAAACRLLPHVDERGSDEWIPL